MGHHHHKINRRTFLGQSSCAAVGMTTLYSTMLNLKSLNAASILNTSGDGDYKALICLLLSGGSDSFNMLMPKSGSAYSEYAVTRSNNAIPSNEILQLNQINNNNGIDLGVHPSMINMQQMFNDGKLAFISNVGTLIEPTDKQGVYNGTDQLPLGLYSHSDQVMHWQTSVPHDRVATGWGGKMADLLNAVNSNNQISMNISLSGSNIFQTGNTSVEYALHPEYGSIGLTGYNNDWLANQVRKEAIDNIVDAQYQDIFKRTYINTFNTAIQGHEQFESALENAFNFQTSFANTRLSNSFEMIAKVISVREQLGMSRQIFFVDYGGWDHHDELLNAQMGMLTEVDDALGSFQSAMEEINASDCVTTFGISEFSRTLLSNGNGTDHGWGGNMFAMGGAVNGQTVYGSYPSLAIGGNLEVGNGVLIPTLSADEYFAELAMWYGVPNSDLIDIFPNLGNFYSIGSGNPIGFMDLTS